MNRFYKSDSAQKILCSFDMPLKNSMSISRDQLIIPLKIRARWGFKRDEKRLLDLRSRSLLPRQLQISNRI